jgi:pSer/pThr/pTyr-binding forkhead associated (FHA) protein
MWLLESDGPDTERATFRLPDGAIKTIGRATGAEFILDAPLVSRLHCQLSSSSTAIQVKDLDSTNGTFVNDKRVAGSAELRPGDVLRVGRVELKVSRQG